MEADIQKALKAKRESKYIEFKETFDIGSKQGWCEILKDVVAIANSGGGVILVGVDNRGDPAGTDVGALLKLDPAKIADQIRRYTNTDFTDFEVQETMKREGKTAAKLAAILVAAPEYPLVFSRPGTYPDPDRGGRQKTAFSAGTVYFRHGAKSEPGTTDDLRKALERRLTALRKGWMSGVRKVFNAAPGSQVTVLPPEIRDSADPGATPIRVTDDPTAPAYRVVDYDKTHPHRGKELISTVKKRLPAGVTFNSYDVVTIRHVHRIDGRSELFHRGKYTSPQYSDEFVNWIVDQHERDPEFFRKTRRKYRNPKK